MGRELLSVLVVVLFLAGCVADPSPAPTATPSETRGPAATVLPSPSPTTAPSAAPTGTASASPSASPEPTLGLEPPPEADERVVEVDVQTNVGADGGEIVVSVTSRSEERIGELVVRWPRELNRVLFLRPFVPSEERIREGGPPLVQTWTKWVLGPGEEGEPAGTVSLGYGPLLAGATLNIPIDVVRRADGPVDFDLQVLAENSLLTLSDGSPAELRIEVP